MADSGTAAEAQNSSGESFKSRRVFIFAAIGSAVGLGNIWRFPYVAYEGGGGAFIVPYLVALLTAGLPFLFFDYAMGHRYRGSSPLSFRRMGRWAEPLGWWQVLVCTVISVYYAAVVAWSLCYMWFSVKESWGKDPEGYFFGTFLQAAENPGPTLDFVPGVLIPMVAVWLVVLVVLAMGVQAGIGRTAVVFIPMLVIAFAVLVVRALFLDGSTQGLDALFSPNWSALTEAGVWVSAFGQIFFSLSVGFGIMITYASYVGRKTDLTGSGAVVGFSNSGFELLAGIGVFSALGFMAAEAGVRVDQVVSDGIGLAFVAFPTIISEAPLGWLIGVLFFGSLFLAGLTSMISIVEVVLSAVRDKFAISRRKATWVVGLPFAVVSILMFSTTGGVYLLDTVDAWINSFGILAVAVVSMLCVAYVWRRFGPLARHVNAISSIKLGFVWKALLGLVTPVALVAILYLDAKERLKTPYEGYPEGLLFWAGWFVVLVIPFLAVLISLVPWRDRRMVDDPGEDVAAPVGSEVNR